MKSESLALWLFASVPDAFHEAIFRVAGGERNADWRRGIGAYQEAEERIPRSVSLDAVTPILIGRSRFLVLDALLLWVDCGCS